MTGFKIFSVREKQLCRKLTAERNCRQVNLDLKYQSYTEQGMIVRALVGLSHWFVWSLIHINDVIQSGVPGSILGWVAQHKGGE